MPTNTPQSVILGFRNRPSVRRMSARKIRASSVLCLCDDSKRPRSVLSSAQSILIAYTCTDPTSGRSRRSVVVEK